MRVLGRGHHTNLSRSGLKESGFYLPWPFFKYNMDAYVIGTITAGIITAIGRSKVPAIKPAKAPKKIPSAIPISNTRSLDLLFTSIG